VKFLWLNLSVENSDIKKTIAVISSVSGAQTGSSVFFLKKIIPELSKHFNIDLFIPERAIKEYSIWKKLDCSVRHLHTLPYQLSVKDYYNIIYSLDNHISAFLCSWYLKLYPGMVVLQDKNFFRLECEALGHGSDSFELNSLVQSEYGDTAIKIGDQHIRQRSLDVYAELYPFLRATIRNAFRVVVFGGSDDFKELAGERINHLNRIFFLESVNVPFNSTCENGKRVCVLIESPYSRASLDILRMVQIKKTIGNFPMPVLIETDSHGAPVSVSLLRADEAIDLSQLDGLIVAGNRPYHGIRGLVCEAIQAGLPVSCEYSGEYRDMNLKHVLYHGKDESLVERLHSVKSNEFLITEIHSGKVEGSEILIQHIHESADVFKEKLYMGLEKQRKTLLESLDENMGRFNQGLLLIPEVKVEIFHLQQQCATNAEIFF
jgi:hypothetical protein